MRGGSILFKLGEKARTLFLFSILLIISNSGFAINACQCRTVTAEYLFINDYDTEFYWDNDPVEEGTYPLEGDSIILKWRDLSFKEGVYNGERVANTPNDGNPFNDYQLPSAIIKFKQGFGRLIRNKTDTGIVVILDSRIVNKSYGPKFLAAIPKCKTEIDD